MKEIKIQRVSFSPGYGDMLGCSHESTLKQEKEGGWILVSRDRKFHSEPTVVTVWRVTDEAVEQFERFIKDKKILALENRPKSDMFVTDYSPWSWQIDYDTVSFGKPKRVWCSIGEYKKYSGADYALLKELENRFEALRGVKISETAEERA